MDDAPESQSTVEPAPRARPAAEGWRGDIRDRPPAWSRRPRGERVRQILGATLPLLAQITEGRSWT